VAILGGGMAGVTTAWRLSEPGWERDLESITLYQRGWRLGGKGASSRGVNGRIEEHGLHLWLGYYDNAFRVLRECYEHLDRPNRDPDAPIRTWRDAMLPSTTVGLEDLHRGEWRHWLGAFSGNDLEPGAPLDSVRSPSMTDLTTRGLRLVADFVESLPTVGDEDALVLTASSRPPTRVDPALEGLRLGILAGLLDAVTQLQDGDAGTDRAVAALDGTLSLLRDRLEQQTEVDPDLRRMWHLVSLMTATNRGMLADGVLTRHDGFRRVNDEDFLDWIMRHGAAPGVADFAFMRGLYDLVFAPGDEHRSTRGVGAGVAIAVTVKMFFEYRGAIFWKMAAGMGDVVFAPLHQALTERGVRIEYFHRLDELEVAADGTTVDTIRFGRQARLAPGRDRYDPLVRVRGLPCFPDRPLLEQLDAPAELAEQPLESHFCTWPDAEERLLRRGEDFDVAVLAVPVDMAVVVGRRLLDQKPAWRRMVGSLGTTATLALQLWLKKDEPSLGWGHPGVTVSAFEQPYSTWASMPQLIEVEDWPADDTPGAIAYFCGAFEAPWPPDRPAADYVAHHEAWVRDRARRFLTEDLPHLLPGLRDAEGFRWDLLSGWDGTGDPLDSQFLRANIDPSDRYVLCVPGSDQHRLRSDESGYDNLFLAGDWTDNGLNAGCIEAAVLSGLQAANAVLGRSRYHRITGILPR
jgi:uncharacterized protein with NAD-binding domain and iron-sulfur cluster